MNSLYIKTVWESGGIDLLAAMGLQAPSDGWEWDSFACLLSLLTMSTPELYQDKQRWKEWAVTHSLSEAGWWLALPVPALYNIAANPLLQTFVPFFSSPHPHATHSFPTSTFSSPVPNPSRSPIYYTPPLPSFLIRFNYLQPSVFPTYHLRSLRSSPPFSHPSICNATPSCLDPPITCQLLPSLILKKGPDPKQCQSIALHSCYLTHWVTTVVFFNSRF